MNPTLITTIVAIIFLGIGFFVGKLISKLNNEKETSTLEVQLNSQKDNNTHKESQISRLEEDIDVLREENKKLTVDVTKKISDQKHLQDKLKDQKQEVENLQEKFTKEFENLANKILEKNSSKITEQNKENLKSILDPLNEKIKSFQDKVETSNKENIRHSSFLKQQLEELSKNNLKISQEAINLTKALKGDNKIQGNWGELVLERVLEKSGLVKGREYEVQQSFLNEEGKRLLPDVIVNLHDGKKMIIDSKVSLTAYEQLANSESKEDKRKFLSEHINSIKRHINDLSSKKYEDIYKIESPNFILMFIPIEPALYLAQNEDQNFFYTAFNKNILIVSPTTLLSTLRTIDALWSNEKQQQNAFDIAKHATSLYGKFKSLLDDLETVGNRISSTNTAYTVAMKKLTGNQNLIKDIDKLEELGITPKHKISSKWIGRAE